MNPIINRLLKYVHATVDNKSNPPDDPSIKPLHERSFDRFSIEFQVLVASADDTGKETSETSELRDVSGSGAMFVTAAPERYFMGQRLKLDIFLAGTNAVRACVKTEAEVVRIQSMHLNNDSDRVPGRGRGTTGVAVKFFLPFEFQRMDHLR